ncbi:MAG: cation diffusion facilitator family transporter [Candidatus Cryptobacteroides sp.]
MAHNHQNIQLSRMLIVCSVINLLYVAIEATVGVLASSAGLVSDAGHNLSDVATLLISLAAVNLASKRPETARKLTIANALLLIAAVILIAVEGIDKLIEPEPIQGTVVSVTAGIGIIINGVTAFLLMREQNRDINIKASFLHMVSDTLVSVGVLISGLLITKTGIYIIDPIISLVIAAIIFVPAMKLLVKTLKIKRE